MENILMIINNIVKAVEGLFGLAIIFALCWTHDIYKHTKKIEAKIDIMAKKMGIDMNNITEETPNDKTRPS